MGDIPFPPKNDRSMKGNAWMHIARAGVKRRGHSKTCFPVNRPRPVQTKLVRTRPVQTSSDQLRQAQTDPDQFVSAQTGLDNTRPPQTRPDQPKPDQTSPERLRSARTFHLRYEMGRNRNSGYRLDSPPFPAETLLSTCSRFVPWILKPIFGR